MSGAFSVPFAAFAIFSATTSGKLIWTLSAIVAFVFTTFRIWRAEHNKVKLLEDAIAPNIRLSFNIAEGEEGCAKTPIRIPLDHSAYSPANAIYLRIRVDSITDKPLRASAFITKLEKKIPGSVLFSVIALPHPIPIKRDFEVVKNIFSTVDFISADSYQQKIFPQVPDWPLVLEKVFEDWATYVLTISVNAGTITETIRVGFSWIGAWDSVVAIKDT